MLTFQAIIKAAIRTKCHVIARRYEHQRLERLHGSNVKWLVLSDELFDEVCSDFTIRKLDMSRQQKRAMFDAEWVSQVTYELITKPARPRRGRQQSSGDGTSSQSQEYLTERDTRRDSRWSDDWTTTLSTQQPRSRHHEQVNEIIYSPGRHDSIMCLDPALLPNSNRKSSSASPVKPTSTRSGWFDTILN